MPAMKEIRRNDLRSKSVQANWLRFWRLEYTRRKFYLDYPPDSPQRNELRKLRMRLSERMCQEPYIPTDAITRLSVAKDAVAYYHNSVTKNPKYFFDAPHLTASNPNLPPLLRDCEPEISVLRGLAFKYGYFIEDLWGFSPAEKIVEAMQEGARFDLPREFPRENDDANWPCRINYCDAEKHQHFEEEHDGYIYLYLNAMSELPGHSEEIQKLPGKLKSTRNKKKAAFGDREKATLQICVDKKLPAESWTDIQTFCLHAINKQHFAYNPALADCDLEGFWWVIYGLDYEQLAPGSRAYGLWLWDLVDAQGKTLEQAMGAIWNLAYEWLSNQAPESSTSHRILQHTRKCIDAMNVLKLTTE